MMRTIREDFNRVIEGLRKLEDAGRKLQNQNAADVIKAARGRLEQILDHPDIGLVVEQLDIPAKGDLNTPPLHGSSPAEQHRTVPAWEPPPAAPFGATAQSADFLRDDKGVAVPPFINKDVAVPDPFGSKDIAPPSEPEKPAAAPDDKPK